MKFKKIKNHICGEFTELVDDINRQVNLARKKMTIEAQGSIYSLESI